MLREAIDLLNAFGLVDGNDLPDSAPGDTYQFRSCKPNIIVATSRSKIPIIEVLKQNGFSVKQSGMMLKISK